ncbi:MerR family transcriptional regulator [Stackebrandtia nassauensis]|uniref:Transcriptional regulator, MerR family n=1 Tax=Stackebrandtia nassauensis (strain DSM 44728 / CIP 108903 / NRRL B-16338 / NBRC 102104 / LLR-40K-21) TaxID=446470 RepID=D3PTY1_STANL|nr:MerR family transcriptional regulator [Stackebrandtia nassauensis]ADD39739.1 transcriptional regulator, MerR family [Stackebrandtia nassauensis DSM 44728]
MMRIGELSNRSNVPVATIKFYVREGLLPSGQRAKANQVSYDESHLRRLRLIRALVDVGKLSIATARRVLAILDDPSTSAFTGMGKAQYALSGHPDLDPDTPPPPAAAPEDLAEVDDLLARHGWSIRPGNPARAQLATAMATARALGLADGLELLDTYADAAQTVAEADVGLVVSPQAEQGTSPEATTLEESIERMLVWTVVGGQALAALRLLAQEATATKRL